jgi:hypothetical protein
MAQEVKQYKDEFGQWGLKDAKGNIILKAQYDNIGRFYEGYASVRKRIFF